MTDEAVHPSHRFGYHGDAPIHLGRDLHVDAYGADHLFVGRGGDWATKPAYTAERVRVSRTELVEAARAILRHFGESA